MRKDRSQHRLTNVSRKRWNSTALAVLLFHTITIVMAMSGQLLVQAEPVLKAKNMNEQTTNSSNKLNKGNTQSQVNEIPPNQLVEQLEQLQNEIKQQSRPVSLEEAVSIGLTSNPQLQQAFNTIQQYEWQLISAQRQWYPTLQLNNGIPFIGYNWQTYIQQQSGMASVSQPVNASNLNYLQSQGSGGAVATGFIGVQPGISLSWNFIDPTRKPNISAASQSLKQQKLLFDVSVRNLILTIQQRYYQVQSTKQLIDSFKEIYAINQRQLSIIAAQRKIGMATVMDLEQQRSQLFIQLNQLVQYTHDYIIETAALAEALGLNKHQLAIPSTAANMVGDWSLPLNTTIDQALAKREEIMASLAAAESANWSGIAALKSYLPVLQLVGSGSILGQNGYQSAPVGSDPSPYFSTSSYMSAAAGLGFSWSLYDGGIQAGNAQSAFAQSRQQRAQAAITELQVEQQVRSSYGQYVTSRVALSSAQAALSSAQIAQRAAQARFNVGVGDITSLVQAIQQLSQSAQLMASSLLAYNNAVAQLYRYSAIWPLNAQQLLQERIKQLREGSAVKP